MSITVKFSMGPKKNWFFGTVWNQDTAEELAKNLALDMGYHCDAAEGYLIFQFCPEGFLWMTWQENKLMGECQTNIAGPGFHAAVIHFIELFACRGEMKLKVEDQTGYFIHRDFQKMRREYFYQWFGDLMNHVIERRGEDVEQLVCWPSEYYLPEERKGMVVTHIRRFPMNEIYGVVHSGLSMSFAKDFFIWNEEEKDAYFYRNCGLVLLNQECYFMPSARSAQDRTVNDQILRYLEKALLMDPAIPFPKEEYLMVCGLDGREPVDVSQVEQLPGAVEISCRRGMIYRKIGCIRFAVPGSFLYDANAHSNTEHYYDGEDYGGHDFYICALNTDETAKFQEEPFLKERVAEVLSFDVDKASCKVAVYSPQVKNGTERFNMSGQVIYKNQITIISVSYTDPGERDWALGLFQKVQTID